MSAGSSADGLLWLATYLLHSSLLLGGAWLFDRLRNDVSPALRASIWRMAMFGAVLTATLQTAGILDPVSGIISITRGDNETAAIASFRDAEVDGSLIAATALDSPGLAATEGDWGFVLILCWAAGALILAAGIARSALAARRELRDRQPLRQGMVLNRARALARAARLRGEPRISTSSRIRGPMTLPGGEICIPDWVPSSLSTAQLDAMLAHEMAHWLRRDALWQVTGLVLHAVLFVQPLNGLARRRLASLAELAADDWAAALTGQGHALAECLATFATACRRRSAPAFAAAIFQGPGTLVLRVERLLAGRHQNGILTRRQQAVLALATLVVATALPGVMAQSRDSTTRTDHVSRAELDWIASASERRGTSASFRSVLAPEQALSAVTTALEQNGWTTSLYSGFSQVFSPSPVNTIAVCRGDLSLRVSMQEADSGSVAIYSVDAIRSAPPCEADDSRIASYIPDLHILGMRTSGVRNVLLGAAGWQESSTILLPDETTAELESLLSARLVEQGWVADPRDRNNTTVTSSWSRRARPDLDLDSMNTTVASSWSRRVGPELYLDGMLSVTEMGRDAGVRVSFRIAQASEESQ